jgi:predicted ArsR family transcriptional regulator
MLTKQLLDTTRGRIVTLLQSKPLTVEELGTQLGLTANAVRSQLTAMERDGLVRRTGRRPGITRKVSRLRAILSVICNSPGLANK